MSKDDFFIGWESETPARDRRTFLAAGLTLSAAALAGGAGIAKLQNAPGAGTWDQGNVRSFTGVATADPYAALQTRDVDGQLAFGVPEEHLPGHAFHTYSLKSNDGT